MSTQDRTHWPIATFLTFIGFLVLISKVAAFAYEFIIKSDQFFSRSKVGVREVNGFSLGLSIALVSDQHFYGDIASVKSIDNAREKSA